MPRGKKNCDSTCTSAVADSVARSDSHLVQAGGERRFEVCRAGTGPEHLLALPGGPGCTYEYLSPLLRLARKGRQILLMNPRGVGKSWTPRRPDAYTFQRMARDVEQVRKAIGARRIHVLGYSAGGMTAIEYAARYPTHLAGLILCSTAPSARECHRANRWVRSRATPAQRSRLRELESARGFESPEYRALVTEINAPFTTRFASPCCDLLRGERSNPVYRAMFSRTGDEYRLDGTAAGWDRTRALAKIQVPTLVLTGKYDFLRGASERIAAQIRGADLRVLPRSSHMTVQEQTAEFLRAVGAFVTSTSEAAS